ncbi:MAG: putative ABC transporter ATP-binding protein [Calditrichaeota bacterium]|nr:putative ABC transporter ATP-binding protein [Calditrichota bacterium]
MNYQSNPIIRLRDLRKVYSGGGGDVVAVDRLTLDIDPGMTVFTGPSGCGKSTLINLVGAFDRPSGGTVEVSGIRVDQLDNSALDQYRRTVIGIVFQFFHLMPALTVLENTALPGELAGMLTRDARARAAELLEKVGLGDRLAHRPHELSGGEIQRTAIARALVNRPRVVLADEPTGNLDSASSERVMNLFADVAAEEGASAIVATHDPDVVLRADRIVELWDGRIVER